MKSDNLLLTFAVIAVIASILSAGVAYNSLSSFRNLITGFATDTDTAYVNVTVESSVDINFTTRDINFETGTIDPGQTAVLTSLGSTTGGTGFTTVTQGFVLENIGNKDGLLSLMTNKNADAFIGVSGGAFQYNISALEPSSCDAGAITLGAWVDVNTTSPGTRVCSNFSYVPDYDTVRIDVRLSLPENTPPSAKTAIFTATLDDGA